MKKGSTFGERLSSIFIAYTLTCILLAAINIMDGDAVMAVIYLVLVVVMAIVAVGCRQSQGFDVERKYVNLLKVAALFVSLVAAIAGVMGALPYLVVAANLYIGALLVIQANVYQRQLENVS